MLPAEYPYLTNYIPSPPACIYCLTLAGVYICLQEDLDSERKKRVLDVIANKQMEVVLIFTVMAVG